MKEGVFWVKSSRAVLRIRYFSVVCFSFVRMKVKMEVKARMEQELEEEEEKESRKSSLRDGHKLRQRQL